MSARKWLWQPSTLGLALRPATKSSQADIMALPRSRITAQGSPKRWIVKRAQARIASAFSVGIFHDPNAHRRHPARI
ncbi:MAG: hypothetical protein HY922_03210, partial [Elusimicrobia bacterium]|nr:hypothetical protein [Elusimicrobiota bacterium]